MSVSLTARLEIATSGVAEVGTLSTAPFCQGLRFAPRPTSKPQAQCLRPRKAGASARAADVEGAGRRLAM